METTRRATQKIAADMKRELGLFEVDDIVYLIIGSSDFTGAVTAIEPRTNTIMVDWGDGCPVQHTPDELKLVPYVVGQLPRERARKIREKNSRRGRLAANPSMDQFVGNPDTHGIDKPRGGGFSIMQQLQDDLAPEALSESKEGPKIASRRVRSSSIVNDVTTAWDDAAVAQDMSTREPDVEPEGEVPFVAGLRSRRAIYWGGPGRVYRLTKQEQEAGSCNCPKCKKEMSTEPFVRGDKLIACPSCGFKVPSSKTTTKRVEVEIDQDGEVEIEVTGSRRSRC